MYLDSSKNVYTDQPTSKRFEEPSIRLISPLRFLKQFFLIKNLLKIQVLCPHMQMYLYISKQTKKRQRNLCHVMQTFGIDITVHNTVWWDENPYYIKSVSLIRKICTKIICDLLEPLFCYKHENAIVFGGVNNGFVLWICPCIFKAQINDFLKKKIYNFA